MRNFDTDNKWSPFDPEWYADAFDKHTSVDEELFNKDEILKAGYVVPDADGSKSSVFRSEAVLNNSFNEDALRETLKQIYLNNTHRLAAANHDSVHYFSWSGKFTDENVSVSGNVCEVILPTDSVIPQQIRNRFKINQFYDRWINITDILQNWKSFRFNVLLFIDHRIYSEYELMFGEQQTKIRFRCFERWIKNNYPIYVYKFDTNCQDRVFMTAGKVVNKYGWKVPVTEFQPSIQSQDRVILALNRIGDKTVRGDNIDADTLGDNLEFLPIVNGEIDFYKMSDYNKNLIISATTEKLWCSVFVPKYMHEYPILLPVDVIYRRYQPHFVHVKVQDEGEHKNVNVPNDTYQEPARVYIDLYENEDINGSWKQLIRPIV
ncbi:MAG: hypothetical protein J5614_03390, partial [Paludibacteraceae bacterium]|nr:hypothetical protein [Paludibacteraceae bacterium]